MNNSVLKFISLNGAA